MVSELCVSVVDDPGRWSGRLCCLSCACRSSMTLAGGVAVVRVSSDLERRGFASELG